MVIYMTTQTVYSPKTGRDLDASCPDYLAMRDRMLSHKAWYQGIIDEQSAAYKALREAQTALQAADAKRENAKRVNDKVIAWYGVEKLKHEPLCRDCK